MSIPVEVGRDRAWGGAAEVEEDEGKAWARGIGEGRGRGWPERRRHGSAQFGTKQEEDREIDRNGAPVGSWAQNKYPAL